MADGGEVVIARAWLLLALASVCCCTRPPVPTPVVPDATPEAGCGTIDKINAARLIRAPDGSALYVPCEAGK